MKSKPLYRIAITGPESSGKTTLARDLAAYFRTVWVPEYSREYLESLGRRYGYEDLEPIARGQAAGEDRYALAARRFLFCDTDMLVMKVWAEYRFGRCPSYILDTLKNRPYDLHVLCSPGIPWEYDPLRENPGEREELYRIYLAELIRMGAGFIEVDGSPRERVLQVVGRLSLFE